MKFHTRDWLDNKELRRCSPASRGVLADLMCLAHEGSPYGHLSDRMGPLTDDFMAARCILSPKSFRIAVEELKTADRLRIEGGVIYIPRMVSDEATRVRRAEGGKASIGHPNTPPPKSNEGYPSLSNNGNPCFEIDSRARMRADSDSGSNAFIKSETSLLDSDFHAFAESWPQNAEPNRAAQMWISVVTPENISSVMACRSRYVGSQQWLDGRVQELWRWLQAQSQAHWGGKWPPASANGNGRKLTPLEELQQEARNAKQTS
jgi:hypothetical protein